MSEDFEALDKKDERVFAALRRELTPALEATLSNRDGWARLRALSDEEWQAAVDADAGEDDGP